MPPSRPVGAEDIRDLQGGTLHEAALRGPHTLQRTEHFAQGLGGHVRIERGGLQFFVAEQHLDGADIFPLLEQMGGKGVPVMPSAELST
jgi:hypothetical protein